MKSYTRVAEIWPLVALSATFFILLSCNNDDVSVETISYKDNLDGAGWTVDFEKAEIDMFCIENSGIDIDEDLATDMTGVVFQDNTIKLTADYRDSCPNNYQSQSISWASATKEFNEINIDSSKTKQIVIKLTRDSNFTSNMLIFQIGANSYFYNDENHLAFERAIEEFEVVFDFEKNRHSIKYLRKVNGELFEKDIELKEFTGSEEFSIFADREYYFNPKITFTCRALSGDDAGPVFYSNRAIIKSLEISVTSIE